MGHITNLDIIVVIVYLVGIAWLGVYQTVKIKTSGDYFAGGRTFNKWLMMMHSLGTGTHADDPVGVTGAAYERGLSGIWYTFVYLFCTPFYWIIAPVFRRARFVTTADFFKARFGVKMAFLYAIMGILTFTVNIGTMLKGTGAVAAAMGIPENLAVIGMTVVFVGYGLAGGLIATVVTESVQGLFIIVMSVLLIPFGLAQIGGFTGLHSIVSADKFSMHAPAEMTISWIIMGTVMSLIGIISQPHTMEVCSTGKTEWEGRVGFTYGNFIKRFCAMGWALTGVIVFAMVLSGKIPGLERRELAFGTAIATLLPSGLTGLMFAAILAAQMSTLSAFMVASSALMVRNIYKEHVNPAATDRQILGLARWVGLLTVALGIAFSFLVSGVAEALTIFWGITTLTGLLIWGGVLWRKTNSTGAWISFAVMAVMWGILGPLGAKIKPLLDSAPAWLGMYGDKKMLSSLGLSYLPAGVIALIIGSLVSQRDKNKTPAFVLAGAVCAAWLILTPPLASAQVNVGVICANSCLAASVIALVFGLMFTHLTDQKALDRFYMLLRTPVGREGELTEAGVDMVYAGQSEGHPWELKHPRLVNLGGFLIALVFSLVILLALHILSRIGA